MSDKKNDDFKELDELNEEDFIIPENQFDPEDRFTTQDLTEIDNLVNEMNLLNDNDEEIKDSPDVVNEIPEETEDIEVEEPVEELESSEEEPEKENLKVKPIEFSSDKDKIIEEDFVPDDDDIVLSEKTPEEAETKHFDTETKQTEESVVSEPENQKQENPENSEASEEVAAAEKPEENKKVLGKKNSNQRRTKGLPRRTKKSNWKHTLAVCLGVIAVLGVIGLGGVYLLYTANFTDISNTRYTPKDKTYIYSSDNVEIAAIFSENRSYVSIEQVPDNLKNALVAVEDSRFYQHGGVDYFGVLRALVSNILRGNLTGQGASTLTQQLARLLYLPDISTESTFLDSLNRKFKEISISYQLEEKYTKDQILEMYLNEYYFGSASYGVEAAAETYFGKPVGELNLAEAAMIAGLPQAPSIYAPNDNFDLAKERQQHVLNRMVENGYITQEQADEAYNTPLTIVPWSENDINNQIQPGYQNFVGKVIDEYAKAMTPGIMKERGLSEEEANSYARENISSGGYKIYTTLDTRYQQVANNTMESMLDAYGYSQEEGYTGSLVTVNRSGAVMAYYGGNESYSDIDMADSPRQPGSNIKPLYYALGLESGAFSTSSILNDAPINIAGYTPSNSGGGYSGPISFAQSLVQSKNTTSVQIFNTLGTTNAVDWIKQFGFDTITDDDYNLAVALGGLTYGLKPYQMAAAFNTFNNNGVYNQAYFINRVTTSVGDVVLDKNNMGLQSKQIMSPQTASTMWGLMNQVVLNGTGTSAQCGIATAGKTGTTDNSENLWFTGMTSDITSSIWLGNLDYYVIGGTSQIPAGIYGQYMRNLINAGYIQ